MTNVVKSGLKIGTSVDAVLGVRTRWGCRIVGAEESTE